MGITRWIRAWELCAQDLATQTLENTKTLQETTEQIKSIEVVSTEKQTQVNVGESTKEIIEKTTTTKVIEKEKEKEKEKQIETGESEDDNTANSSDLSSEEESTSSEDDSSEDDSSEDDSPPIKITPLGYDQLNDLVNKFQKFAIGNIGEEIQASGNKRIRDRSNDRNLA